NSIVPPDDIGRVWTADEVAGALTAMGPDSQARTVSTTYDNLGRKSTVTQPSADYYFSSGAPGLNANSVATVSAAATTRFDYDMFGDLVHEATLIDTNGTGSSNGPGTWRDTWHYFDVLGRETLTVDALGYQTVRTYDNFGNLALSTQ